jgi:hypothetical protein
MIEKRYCKIGVFYVYFLKAPFERIAYVLILIVPFST